MYYFTNLIKTLNTIYNNWRIYTGYFFALEAVFVYMFICLDTHFARSSLQFSVVVVFRLKLFSISCVLWVIGLASGALYFHILHQPFVQYCIQSNVDSIAFSILVLLVVIVIPFVICLISYRLIFVIANQQVQRIQFDPSTIDGYTMERINERKRNSKAKKTISWLVGAFALFCLPFVFFHIIDATLKLKYPYKKHVEQLVKWLSYLNSTCNWALYTLLNRELRGPLIALLPDCILCTLVKRTKFKYWLLD